MNVKVARLLFCAGIIFALVPLHASMAKDFGFDAVVGKIDGSFEIVHMASQTSYAAFVRQNAQKSSITFIEPVVTYSQTGVTPNDSYFLSQSNLSAIDASTAWDTTKGSTDITVAILDSGVDILHPDIVSNIWQNSGEVANNGKDDDGNGFADDYNGWDFVDSSKDVTPRSTGTLSAKHHGTVIAGIVGAVGNNSRGVAGIAWNVQLMPVRVLDASGNGLSSRVALGIRYAADNGADIINLSFTGSQSSMLMMQAIQYARSRGVIVIASAGNDNLNLNVTPRYPVCHSGVIGVASVSDSGVKSSFSNYGNSCVDISAPGENIISTASTESGTIYVSGYAVGWDGTSFSSPAIAGVAVLALAHQSDLTREQLETLLISSSNSLESKNPSYPKSLGSGMVSASKAVNYSAPPKLSGDAIVTFPLTNGGPHLRWFTKNGSGYQNAFIEASSYRGTGSITVCDVNGDGLNEIIFGTGKGVESQVRILDAKGNTTKSYRAFSSPQNGIRVACGDTNGDGKDDVIAIREEGSSSEVRIFNENGSIRKRFFAYNQSFLGGMDIGAADVNADGKAEIITGMGPGALPRVQIFSEEGTLLKSFFAYGLGYRGGVNVAAADVDGDGAVEIVTAPRFHGGPHVRIFSSSGKAEGSFFAYGEGFHGGVSLATGDIDGDGVADIITGAGIGGGPHVQVFKGYGDHTRLASFFAYAASFSGGVQVESFSQFK